MATQAVLKIQLFADKVLVAESEDEQLWTTVLARVLAKEKELDEKEQQISGEE
jgi:hypothetical protein